MVVEAGIHDGVLSAVGIVTHSTTTLSTRLPWSLKAVAGTKLLGLRVVSCRSGIERR